MDGGTFTISNGGVFGSMFGTPIINPPQSSILGMHGIFNRPVAVKGQVNSCYHIDSILLMSAIRHYIVIHVLCGISGQYQFHRVFCSCYHWIISV